MEKETERVKGSGTKSQDGFEELKCFSLAAEVMARQEGNLLWKESQV